LSGLSRAIRIIRCNCFNECWEAMSSPDRATVRAFANVISPAQIGAAKFDATKPRTSRGPSSAIPYRSCTVSRVITMIAAVITAST
jgi:hypothetical protein